MSRHNPTLFDGARLTMDDSIQLTLENLRTYGPLHDHWGIAWSGGKDSTATLTLIMYMLDSGWIERPKSLTVWYADTRQELPPLYAAALGIIERLETIPVAVQRVMAPLDKRFLVYILGRGVPPPNNNTLRWCTRQIKVDPMTAAVAEALPPNGETLLMLTGVRLGESAARDQRIALSCSRDGAECGQGWYQQLLPNAAGIRGRIATLAPILHWRVCHVWDWLNFWAPDHEYGGWPTRIIAEAYGGDEAEEIGARTGCIGCPLASEERALDAILRQPQWQYLEPLKRLKPLYRELRLPQNRLRKTGYDRDGTLSAGKNKQRLGPLTFAAREAGLAEVLAIQNGVNSTAVETDRPLIDILNAEETARIRELIAARIWPNGWAGDEPLATTPMDAVFQDGVIQPLLGMDMGVQL